MSIRKAFREVIRKYEHVVQCADLSQVYPTSHTCGVGIFTFLIFSALLTPLGAIEAADGLVALQGIIESSVTNRSGTGIG
jgi:hypothetical protein